MSFPDSQQRSLLDLYEAVSGNSPGSNPVSFNDTETQSISSSSPSVSNMDELKMSDWAIDTSTIVEIVVDPDNTTSVDGTADPVVVDPENDFPNTPTRVPTEGELNNSGGVNYSDIYENVSNWGWDTDMSLGTYRIDPDADGLENNDVEFVSTLNVSILAGYNTTSSYREGNLNGVINGGFFGSGYLNPSYSWDFGGNPPDSFQSGSSTTEDIIARWNRASNSFNVTATLTVIDGYGNQDSAQVTFSVPGSTGPNIDSSDVSFAANKAYNFEVKWNGGVGSFTVKVDGNGSTVFSQSSVTSPFSATFIDSGCSTTGPNNYTIKVIDSNSNDDSADHEAAACTPGGGGGGGGGGGV